MNHILFDIARPLLASAKLPAPFWAEAIDTANKIRIACGLEHLPIRSRLTEHGLAKNVPTISTGYKSSAALPTQRISTFLKHSK